MSRFWTQPTDICECGDYRRQHYANDPEYGSCYICGPNDGMNGGRPCLRFRYAGKRRLRTRWPQVSLSARQQVDYYTFTTGMVLLTTELAVPATDDSLILLTGMLLSWPAISWIWRKC